MSRLDRIQYRATRDDHTGADLREYAPWDDSCGGVQKGTPEQGVTGINSVKQRIIPISIVLVLSLIGCRGNRVQKGPSRQPEALVTTAVVTERSVPIDIRVIGNVEASATIRVKAQVSGQLTKVYFQEGRDVKAGDPLFLIDPLPYDEAIHQAEANLAKDSALIRQAEANLKRDVAQEKFARNQAARYQQLFAEGVMSKQQAEQYSSDADARAEAVGADQAAIESARATIQADTSTLENIKLQRSYCDIRSPVDGRTGNLAVEAGNLVRANDPELVTINQIHPVYVTFSVPEARLSEIKRYMAGGRLTVLASPAGDRGQAEQGSLTFVDNNVDLTTGTIKLKGTFPNENSRLWPGQFVNVVLRLTTLPNAVIVPVRAIQMGQSGEFVYVVRNDMTAEVRPVTTAFKVDQEVVVQKGLQPGETIVTEGQLRLAPGMRVRTREGRTS